MTNKVPAAEIEAAKTANGGYTRKTLAQWGVPWPPPKGWKNALTEGRPISEKAKPTKKLAQPRPYCWW
jgi:hypothetical protein